MYSVGYYCHSNTYLDIQSKAMTSCIAYNDFFKGKKMPLKQKALFCFWVNKWSFTKAQKGKGLTCFSVVVVSTVHIKIFTVN